MRVDNVVVRGPGQKPGASLYTRKRLSLDGVAMRVALKLTH